ncbi:uncharacterized protein LOC111269531 isoform X2 [Varroa jacobsoni]|uniref:uncharacterized protein LOC111269531 isoform X2 n=1 Tax=Varroa jacobsoni TaxID=62625 RepID=UPI000BF26289|nr:uncharacterized protein LOC111269531 isoform X2 [Varroa jacobsoni]
MKIIEMAISHPRNVKESSMIEISCDFVEHPRKVRSLPPELTTQSPQESLKPYVVRGRLELIFGAFVEFLPCGELRAELRRLIRVLCFFPYSVITIQVNIIYSVIDTRCSEDGFIWRRTTACRQQFIKCCCHLSCDEDFNARNLRQQISFKEEARPTMMYAKNGNHRWFLHLIMVRNASTVKRHHPFIYAVRFISHGGIFSAFGTTGLDRHLSLALQTISD